MYVCMYARLYLFIQFLEKKMLSIYAHASLLRFETLIMQRFCCLKKFHKENIQQEFTQNEKKRCTV